MRSMRCAKWPVYQFGQSVRGILRRAVIGTNHYDYPSQSTLLKLVSDCTAKKHKIVSVELTSGAISLSSLVNFPITEPGD